MVSQNSDYRRILELVTNWPIEDRKSFANDLLKSLESASENPRRPRPSFSRAAGIARGTGPVPTDEEVKQMIHEHRMEKYGK